MRCQVSSLILILAFLCANAQLEPPSNVTVPSSCNGITKDGLYYIKPSESGPVIPVLCNNQYAMLDISLDAQLLSYPQYLSSYSFARNSLEWITTSLDDTSSFQQWFTPGDADSTLFRVAHNCQTCSSSADFGDHVVYYTDSALFCFASTPTSGCDQTSPDLTLNEYACNICDVGSIESSDARTWTKCTALQMESNAPMLYDHDQCVTHGLTYRPVMSLTRDACTCYKPNLPQTTYSIASSSLPLVTLSSDIQTMHIKHVDPSILFSPNNANNTNTTNQSNSSINSNNSNACSSATTYLSNADFSNGTYRIQSCGHYILTEDIILNFNAPSSTQQTNPSFSPNSIDIDNLLWLPRRDQSSLYAGTYDTYSGSFSLGFFAGLTIEAHNVSIHLNDHSISMHPTFYLQQRFFTLIECGAKYFLPNQGPSNWLIDDQFYAANLRILGPGTLGLSSHHAVHGMRNTNLLIRDVAVTRFEVAGIQCNGCNDVTIENVVVGPQNNDIPVLGRYAHARAMLPRLQQLMAEFGGERIAFTDREHVTVEALVDRLIYQMDMVYFSVINGEEFEEDNVEWMAAKKLFINPTGWMDGGSSYGMVFSGDGAAVVGMGSRTQMTSNVTLRDVEVFGVYNQVLEKIKVSVNKVGATRLILFDTVDWVAVTDQIVDGESSRYVGDAYTDVMFAIKRYVTRWSYLNSLYVTDSEMKFVFEGGRFRDIWDGGSPAMNDESATGCNTDIQLHSSKGAIGLRFDGVDGLLLSNVDVREVVNWAALGASWCGLSDGPGVSNEDADIQYGYTGTRAHGVVMDYVSGVVENVMVGDVQSLHGEATGVVIYKGCDVEVSNVIVNDVRAGTELGMEQVEGMTLPNLVPRACAVDVHENSSVVVVNVVEMGVEGYENCEVMEDGSVVSGEEDGDVSGVGEVSVDGKGDRGIEVFLVLAAVFVVLCVCACVVKFMFCRGNAPKYDVVDARHTEYSPLLD